MRISTDFLALEIFLFIGYNYNMKIVLIGGHPKGFDEPFDVRTRSGKILRKITDELRIKPIFFDLWRNQAEMEAGKIEYAVINRLIKFKKSKHTLIALGRFTEIALRESEIECKYLPHPASRDAKYIKQLRDGLAILSTL